MLNTDNLLRCIALTLLGMGSVSQANAEIQLNGFASIRGTSVSTDGGGDPFPGYSEGEFSFKPESLFALQARADLNN